MSLSQIETPTDSHVYQYPTAEWVAEEQMAIQWPAKELGVEYDENDFRVRLTEGEKYAVQYLQSLLTKFETFIGGEDLWAYRIPKLFPRPEIQRASSVISCIENDSHAPFYMLANQVLNLDTDEFYSKWRNDPIISESVNYLSKVVQNSNALIVAGTLAGLEGVKLFTNLGFFKCFNTRGFNLIPHFVSGIDGSAKDENFHSMFSSYLFRQCKEERIELGNHTDEDEQVIYITLKEIFFKIVEFEKNTANHIFDYSDSLPAEQQIRICTRQELHDFTEDRANYVFNELLGYEPLFDRERGFISEVFYDNLSRYKHSDFFATVQLQYKRNYAKHKITFCNDALDWMKS